MLAGQNLLGIGHCVHIYGMGQSMLEALQPHTVQRTKRQIKDDEIMIDGRGTYVDGSTHNREIEPATTQLVEAETLKKAVNLVIAYWLEHNIISQRCVWKGEVTNVLMTMMHPEELKQAD